MKHFIFPPAADRGNLLRDPRTRVRKD